LVSLIFSLLFLVMGFFFLFVAAWAAYGVYHMLRSSQRSKKYLAESGDEQPLQVDHLSRALAKLVQDTRLLRVSLEAPIRDVGDLLEGEFTQRASEDMEGFDNMLMNVSRQVADWVHTVEKLEPGDRAKLEDAGISAEHIRAALDSEGGAFERKNLQPPGRPPLDKRLGAIVAELGRFEKALQTAAQPYR
jgi:hypothetical protein